MHCILHLGKDGSCTGDIKPFRENYESWKRVQTYSNARTSQQQESKYKDIAKNVPENFKTNDGYHAECYKKFTAITLSKAQISKDQQIKRSKFLRSCNLNVSRNEQNRRVLPALCIFCGKGRKKYKQKWVELSSSEKFESEISIRAAAKCLKDEELLLKIGIMTSKMDPILQHLR